MPKDMKGKVPEADAKKKSEVKTETVKTETKAAEPKKETVLEVKKAEPKKETVAAAKKVEPKKETVPVKKTAVKPKKAKEKAALEPEIYVQYTDNGEQQASITDIVAKIKALYVAEGHRESSIKSLKVYMKPQEWKAYYVINDKIEGNIMIF